MSLHKTSKVTLDSYGKKFEKALKVYRERRSRETTSKSSHSTQHKHYSELPLKGGG